MKIELDVGKIKIFPFKKNFFFYLSCNRFPFRVSKSYPECEIEMFDFARDSDTPLSDVSINDVLRKDVSIDDASAKDVSINHASDDLVDNSIDCYKVQGNIGLNNFISHKFNLFNLKKFQSNPYVNNYYSLSKMETNEIMSRYELNSFYFQRFILNFKFISELKDEIADFCQEDLPLKRMSKPSTENPIKKRKNSKRKITKTKIPKVEKKMICDEVVKKSLTKQSKDLRKLSAILEKSSHIKITFEKSAKSSHHKLNVEKSAKMSSNLIFNQNVLQKFESNSKIESSSASNRQQSLSENISSDDPMDSSIISNPKPFFYSEINSLVLV